MIVAGFGYRAEAELASLVDALTLAQQGWPPVDALATLLDKAPLVERLAGLLELPFLAFEEQAVQGVSTLTNSQASRMARGTGSVSEAVALVGAGPGSRLLSARHIAPDRLASCALAEGFRQ